MHKLRYLMIALMGAGLTACVSNGQFSKPQDLRFQQKANDRTEKIRVIRDHKLCVNETEDQQDCPTHFYIDDIKAGSFYIQNSADFRLKPELHNFKVKNCTDECQVCEVDLKPQDLPDSKIILSLDDQGLPFMLNANQKLICEREVRSQDAQEINPIIASPVEAEALKETTIQLNLAADTLFKFDGSSLQDLLPKGHQEVIDVANKIKTGYVSVRQIHLTGHTDRLGNDLYNQNLGARRADTVRDVLVQYGVDKNIITTTSQGENMPVTNGCYGVQPREALKSCLQPDRRVTVEITGISK